MIVITQGFGSLRPRADVSAHTSYIFSRCQASNTVHCGTATRNAQRGGFDSTFLPDLTVIEADPL